MATVSLAVVACGTSGDPTPGTSSATTSEVGHGSSAPHLTLSAIRSRLGVAGYRVTRRTENPGRPIGQLDVPLAHGANVSVIRYRTAAAVRADMAPLESLLREHPGRHRIVIDGATVFGIVSDRNLTAEDLATFNRVVAIGTAR
jgi:hypothetical protein